MRQRKRGFTVTELVIFIVVIAILAGSMITGFVVLSNEMKAGTGSESGSTSSKA